jgi:hypothetical protein
VRATRTLDAWGWILAIFGGVYRGTKQMLGQVPDPLRIMAHSKPVMWADVMFELALSRAHAVPARLKSLASIKVATLVGCVF